MFDMGGHVIFSHYQYFDGLIEEAVGKGDDFWNTLEEQVRLAASGSAPLPLLGGSPAKSSQMASIGFSCDGVSCMRCYF